MRFLHKAHKNGRARKPSLIFNSILQRQVFADIVPRMRKPALL